MKQFSVMHLFFARKGDSGRCLNRFGLIWSLVLLLTASAMAEQLPERVFETQAVRITFPETGYAQIATRAKDPDPVDADLSESGLSYFGTYTLQVRFCRQPSLPSYMQQVHSGDGWLCSFYVLPPLDEAGVRAEILKRKTKHTDISYQKAEGIGKEAHQGHPMLVWREQSGKTRLDHFLIIGPEQNYLFVSSPYGDGETLRKTVATLSFL